MKDFYLAFENEAEANSVLYTTTSEVLDDEGNVIEEATVKPNFQNIDILGIVYEPRPEDAPEDYEPVPYPAPNYGVNVRVMDSEDSAPLEQHKVDPTPFPQRVWA